MEDYEIISTKERAKNEKLLKEFKKVLTNSGLTTKTIRKHIDNVDFYINEYLLSYDVIEAKDGIDEISMYLGDWFIRKAMWSSKAEIKSNASSLKKFYAFMHSEKLIEDEELQEFKSIIKIDMPLWLESMQEYESFSDDEIW